MDNMAPHLRINISIHREWLKQLDQIAKENHQTRSGMIEQFIRDYRKKV